MHAITALHFENGVYGASFPDFPGCVTTGATLDEALARAEQALAFHIDGMIEDGVTPPEPRSLETLRREAADRLADADLIAAVDYTPPGKPQRINISIDEALLARIDRAAEREGRTRSGYLAAAVRRMIVGGVTFARDERLNNAGLVTPGRPPSIFGKAQRRRRLGGRGARA